MKRYTAIKILILVLWLQICSAEQHSHFYSLFDMIIRLSWEAQPWCLGGGHDLIVLECLILGGYNKFCKDRFMFCIVVTIDWWNIWRRHIYRYHCLLQSCCFCSAWSQKVDHLSIFKLRNKVMDFFFWTLLSGFFSALFAFLSSSPPLPPAPLVNYSHWRGQGCRGLPLLSSHIWH